MNTNAILTKTFIKTLKETTETFTGEFADLIKEVLTSEAVTSKQSELASLIETNAKLAELRAQKRLLVAATKPPVQLDDNGNPIKRKPGRPRKVDAAPVATDNTDEL
jgi:hypothetical protein